MSKNFSLTNNYNIEESLINLGTGNVFVIAIGEDEEMMSLVITQSLSPKSRMNIISNEELTLYLFHYYLQNINMGLI